MEEKIKKFELDIVTRDVTCESGSGGVATATSVTFSNVSSSLSDSTDDIAASMNRAFAALNAGLIINDTIGSIIPMADRKGEGETTRQGEKDEVKRDDNIVVAELTQKVMIKPLGESLKVNKEGGGLGLGPKAIQQQFAMAAAAKVALKKVGGGVSM